MKNSTEKLMEEEQGYPERIAKGIEAIQVLSDWYQKLLDAGYYIKNEMLYRKSDNECLVLLHDIDRQSISVHPHLSWY